MPPRKPILPKDLCIYVAEVGDDGSVPEDAIQLIRQCVMDKIFAENPDHIAICRSDKISNVQFLPATWDALRKVEGDFLKKKETSDDKANPISVMLDVCKYLKIQYKEDSYESKKVLFIGHFKSVDVEDKDVLQLANVLKSQSVSTSFILTDVEAMDERQKKNLSILNTVFEADKFVDLVFVTSMKKAKKQIMNTVSKKPTRAYPWNVVMEIGADIKISVGGYVCTRKNKVGEMKKALMKDVKPVETAPAASRRQNDVETIENSVSSNSGASSLHKTVVVEVAKDVTEKEVVWKEKSGEVVEDADIGKGFYYGDKIVPFNELENEDAYRSGEKCLKLLVFCPLSNIQPAFQQGDGTTLFYPKKQDTESEVKFDALLRAMDSNKRAAIVRKVYLKDKKVQVGVMVPDMERQCLVYSELCFADDVSVPHFPALIKETSSEDEGITSKEVLIDDLIGTMSIDEYLPSDGPVDPAVSQLRASIASKILEQEGQEKKQVLLEDGIDIYFNENRKLHDDLLQKLKEAFPLVVNKEEGDRPSGANIFRKRQRDGDQSGEKPDDKKVKVEEDLESDNPESGIGTTDDKDVDYEDLLDQL